MVDAEALEALLALPFDEFKAALPEGDYPDIQAMCKHLGINAKGQRKELERRILEQVEATRASAKALTKTPEGREGRRRSPKAGVTAATLGAAATKEEEKEKQSKPKAAAENAMAEDDVRTMNAAEFQAKGLAGGSSSASGASGPASWPVPPGLPQFNLATPAPAVATAFASLSPDIATARRKAEVVRTALASASATVDGPTNADLMQKLDRMSQSMALKEDLEAVQLETVRRLRTEFQSELTPVRTQLGQVAANTTQALDETKALNERLIAQEQRSVIEFDRVGRLETEIQELRAQMVSSGAGFKRDKFDPALQRVSFTQWPADTSDDAKVQAMKQFMQKHFASVQCVYVDHFNEKASFVHLATAKAAKSVYDKLAGKKVDGFQGIKVKPALTAVDLSRNFALFRAEDLVKKDGKAQGKDVEVKKGKDRGVYVAGKAAFQQKERYDPRGGFVNDFVHLKLP